MAIVRAEAAFRPGMFDMASCGRDCEGERPNVIIMSKPHCNYQIAQCSGATQRRI